LYHLQAAGTCELLCNIEKPLLFLSGLTPQWYAMPRQLQAREWDWTLFLVDSATEDNASPSPTYIRDAMAKIGGKAVWQLERAPKTGKLHYQGKVQLWAKKTLANLRTTWGSVVQTLDINVCDETMEKLRSIHWSPTSVANIGNYGYVQKGDSRVAGPWDLKWKEEPIPRQLREILCDMPLSDVSYDWQGRARAKKLIPERLYKWQSTCMDILSTYDPRKVHVIIDQVGCSGKSILSQFAHTVGIAGALLPPLNDYKDLMQAVCNIHDDTGKGRHMGFIIDMPRSLPQKTLLGLYSAIEQLKNGVLFDTRYHFKQRTMDSPSVIVMCNDWPKLSYLSRDRWSLHRIEHGILTDIPEAEILARIRLEGA
jgi:hypothetical protein